jgi:ParB-like chromosome segregation protein Spo0J
VNLLAMVKHIELWLIDKLIPFARNPRTHSEAQIAQIAASIAEFGFNNPILVDTKAGIIAGHGRLLAARKLGLTEVPVIVLDHLSEAQKRAYIIADNQLALNAGWDDELLRAELAALQAEDFNVGLIGFEDDELARLLANEDSGLTDEDAVPDPPEDPVTRTGDLWLLGPHRVHCGDATSADAVLRVFPPQPCGCSAQNTAKRLRPLPAIRSIPPLRACCLSPQGRVSPRDGGGGCYNR